MNAREQTQNKGLDRILLAVMIGVFFAGAALRIFGPPPLGNNGHDEVLYTSYVQILEQNSLSVYPCMVELYGKDHRVIQNAELPPTRFLYIFCGYCWDELFWHGENTFESLHEVSCLFSVLMMPLAAVFAWRLGGGLRQTLGVLMLTAVSPLQTYAARYALIDGFFAFWALLCLWLLWENLRRPCGGRWLAAYVASLALMVMTKENAFFVFVGICGILVSNRWLKFGTVDRRLVYGTFAGILLGAAGIVTISGGMDTAFFTYSLFVGNAAHLDYAIATGDGPWHRYIGELMLVSPLVLLLAVGEAFQVTREKKAQLFLLVFIACSYVLMCNVRHGMNLRYAAIWETPLRYLAFSQVITLCGMFYKRKTIALWVCMAALCVSDLRQYYIIFVKNRVYEPVPINVGHALKIYKTRSDWKNR